ncbi:hypothetical protein [Methylobacterium isbiliense]|uniref:hypothetical protein n=1 Tax=Methylobacterium isbiliense TaxID=315478 RepID=UPI001EE1C340|nr:hypothetical protein [Methylobacterium isbiliense]MDN3627139.1 hypothetical protein [Methylobacterium isbiliense]
MFGIGDHWTDAAKLSRNLFPARDIQRHRRHRRERIALMNRLVEPAGLVCEDWDGDAFLLTDRAGRTRVAASLAEFWREAEALSGQAFDPLGVRFDGRAPQW